jgi:hypothetical protein
MRGIKWRGKAGPWQARLAITIAFPERSKSRMGVCMLAGR